MALMNVWVGIDPGASGAVAVLYEDGYAIAEDFGDMSSQTLRHWNESFNVHLCAIEQVGAMPGQGVTSMFNFGANLGWWRGVLDTLRIPYVLVRPQRWGKDCCVPPKKDKADKPSLEVARRMFPHVDLSRKKDHGKADALLLAHWAKTFGGK